MGSHVLYEKKGYKAYIILNKPEKLNALDGEMYQDVLGYLKEADADESIRVVILKGAGRAFSAGYDIQAEMNLVETPMEERAGFRDGSNAARDYQSKNSAENPVQHLAFLVLLLIVTHFCFSFAAYRIRLRVFFIYLFIKSSFINKLF